VIFLEPKERQKDRKTERQKDRETERQKDRKTERQKDKKTKRQRLKEKFDWYNYDLSTDRLKYWDVLANLEAA
jgi:hypothetical protein